MKDRNPKLWKILVGIYRIYCVTADIIRLLGRVGLIATGGIE